MIRAVLISMSLFASVLAQQNSSAPGYAQLRDQVISGGTSNTSALITSTNQYPVMTVLLDLDLLPSLKKIDRLWDSDYLRYSTMKDYSLVDCAVLHTKCKKSKKNYASDPIFYPDLSSYQNDPSKKILSLGEGTGGFLPFMTSLGIHVDGLDPIYALDHLPNTPDDVLSTANLQSAIFDFYKATYSPYLLPGDATDMKNPKDPSMVRIPDESYDMVVSHMLANNFDRDEDVVSLIQEGLRVLKKGGTLRINGIGDMRNPKHRSELFAKVFNAVSWKGDTKHKYRFYYQRVSTEVVMKKESVEPALTAVLTSFMENTEYGRYITKLSEAEYNKIDFDENQLIKWLSTTSFKHSVPELDDFITVVLPFVGKDSLDGIQNEDFFRDMANEAVLYKDHEPLQTSIVLIYKEK